MNLHWRVFRGLIDPELARLVTPAQQKQVMRRAVSRGNSNPRGLMLWWVFFCVAYWTAMSIVRRYLVPGNGAFQVIFMLASSAFFLAISAHLFRHSRAKAFYAAVRDHGYDICSECGYWLRDLTDEVSQCPECGTPRCPRPSDGARAVQHVTRDWN
jgi:hypothetical protein